MAIGIIARDFLLQGKTGELTQGEIYNGILRQQNTYPACRITTISDYSDCKGGTVAKNGLVQLDIWADRYDQARLVSEAAEKDLSLISQNHIDWTIRGSRLVAERSGLWDDDKDLHRRILEFELKIDWVKRDQVYKEIMQFYEELKAATGSSITLTNTPPTSYADILDVSLNGQKRYRASDAPSGELGWTWAGSTIQFLLNGTPFDLTGNYISVLWVVRS